MAGERQRGNEIGPSGSTVAFNLKRLRAGAGLDLRLMSQRLGELGRPISPAALSRIENLERRVDVDDLVVMAIVLDVNPNALLFPPTAQPWRLVQVATEKVADGDTVWKWARGEDTLGTPETSRAAMDTFLEQAPEADREERWRIIQALREAETQKFRSRVNPGSPDDAGPSVGVARAENA